MATVQRVARAAKAAFNADGLQVRQYNEPAAGQTVFHLHFHILPLNEGQTLRPHSGKMADHGVLAKQAELIRKAL
jgi:histidine triad (HIT) family protein